MQRKPFANLGEETKCVLFDCLTLYMSNMLYGKEAPEGDFVHQRQSCSSKNR